MSGWPFSQVDREARIPERQPLRRIGHGVNEALASLDAKFEALKTDFAPLDSARTVDRGEPDPDPVLDPLRTCSIPHEHATVER